MDKWLRNSNVVKVIALLLGILLWVVVHLDNNSSPGQTSTTSPDKIYGVSITPIYDANQYHVHSIEPNNVQITLRGKESAIRKAKNDLSYKIVLDLSGYTAGTHSLPLRPEGFPNGVDVEIYPSTVKVVVEEKESKEVPVVIIPVGNPLEGLKAGQPIIRPNRVLVTVPSSKIDEIESVKGEVSIDHAKSAVVKQVKLAVFNKEGKEVEGIINPPVVDVEVPITVPFKLVPLQIKMVGEPPVGYGVGSFKSSVDQVTVYGTPDVMEGLEFYEGPQINLNGMTKDETFKLNIPLRLNVSKVEPNEVEIELKIVPSTTKYVEKVPLTISGSNSEFATRIVAPESSVVDVLVEGAPAFLDRVKAENIQAIVDVSNLPVGKHELKVNFNLPQFVKKAPNQERNITVEITSKVKNTQND